MPTNTGENLDKRDRYALILKTSQSQCNSPDLVAVLPGAPGRVGRPVLLAGAVGIARLPGGEGERQGGVCHVLPTTGGGRRRCRPTTQNLNIRLAATILYFVDVIQLG